MQTISGTTGQAEYLAGYYAFLAHMRDVNVGGISVVNARPFNTLPAIINAPTGANGDTYSTFEGMINAYFNGLYAENWYTIDPDLLVSLLDWYIEKWTRHGKIMLFTTHGVDPDDAVSMMQFTCALIIMGRNTFLRGHDDFGYELNYKQGGWKNPTFLTQLAGRKLGTPKGEAVRKEYVYTREFEFAQVMLDTEGGCRIEWLNEDGSTKDVWEHEKYKSNIAAGSVVLGVDDFEGTTGKSKYRSRVISDPLGLNLGQTNLAMWAWGEMSRATAKAKDVIDTSLLLANGSPGDGLDELGYLKSTKTDGVFAMYRVDKADATWTFNVKGYVSLTVEMEWAVMGDMPDMGITVDVSLDNGGFQTVFQIGYTPAGTNRYVMDNGREVVQHRSSTAIVNGDLVALLQSDFGTFDARVDLGAKECVGGEVLTVRLHQENGVTGAVVGLDNLKVYGVAVNGAGCNAPGPAPSPSPPSPPTPSPPNDQTLLGYDDYETSNYLTRDIATPRNTGGFTWGAVTRATVLAAQVIDSSKFSQTGGSGDGVDTLGFLKSTKTDGVFAMYRVGDAMVTYTFDVAGYQNLNVGMDWACTGNMPDLGITVTAALDGGAPQMIFRISSATDGSVTYVMEDGTNVVEDKYATALINGEVVGVLKNDFENFEASIKGIGKTLTLTIQQLQGLGNRAVGLDNLRVYGDSV
jgi:hypothetical protein